MVEFEDALGHALDLQDITLLKNALGIYKGDYLEDQGWIWAEPRKKELRKKYMAGLKIWNNIT